MLTSFIRPSPLKQVMGLASWLLLTSVFATIGALASTQAPVFYAQLLLPAWAPPAWLFGPVWTGLYFLMAIAAWMIWRAHGFYRARFALNLFIVQLAANSLWSWLFFAWHRGALAFIEILILWILIAATIVTFWRLQKWAAALLLPYLVWVSFASALAFVTWKLNPELLI